MILFVELLLQIRVFHILLIIRVIQVLITLVCIVIVFGILRFELLYYIFYDFVGALY